MPNPTVDMPSDLKTPEQLQQEMQESGQMPQDAPSSPEASVQGPQEPTNPEPPDSEKLTVPDQTQQPSPDQGIQAPSEQPKEPDSEPQPEDGDTLTAPVPEKEQDWQYWKQRAQTLHGLLKKERENQSGEIERLQKLVDQQSQMLDDLRANHPPQPEDGKPKPGEGSRHVDPSAVTDDELHERFTDRQIEDYGEDFLRMQLAILKRQGNSDPSVQELREQLKTVKQQSAADKLWAAVEREVPNARRINETDEQWDAFLSTRAPGSRRTRREEGHEAIQEGDVKFLVELFKTYLNQHRKPSGQDDITGQALPNNRGGGPQPAQGKRTYKQSEIDRFFQDAAVGGVYSDKEVNAIKADINAAAMEGRIIPG